MYHTETSMQKAASKRPPRAQFVCGVCRGYSSDGDDGDNEGDRITGPL